MQASVTAKPDSHLFVAGMVENSQQKHWSRRLVQIFTFLGQSGTLHGLIPSQNISRLGHWLSFPNERAYEAGTINEVLSDQLHELEKFTVGLT